jgi:hypothetical protein
VKERNIRGREWEKRMEELMACNDGVVRPAGGHWQRSVSVPQVADPQTHTHTGREREKESRGDRGGNSLAIGCEHT